MEVCEDTEVPLDEIGLFETLCSSSGIPSHPSYQLAF
jgi:hypothetical protein